MPDEDKNLEIILTAHEWRTAARKLREHYNNLAAQGECGPESTLYKSFGHIEKFINATSDNHEVAIPGRYSNWAFLSGVLDAVNCPVGYKLVMALSAGGAK